MKPVSRTLTRIIIAAAFCAAVSACSSPGGYTGGSYPASGQPGGDTNVFTRMNDG